MAEFVKKDRTLFLTGAVLFALSLRGADMPAALWRSTSLVQVIPLLAVMAGAWFRRFPLAWGAAALLALIQVGAPLWNAFQVGAFSPDTLLPVALWALVLVVNARKERREVYFGRDA